MLKKSLIFLSILCTIVFTSNLVFASNISDGMSNAGRAVGNGVQTVVNGTGNVLQSAGNGISNMVNAAGNGMGQMVDGIEEGMYEDNYDNNTNIANMNGTNNNNYTANRTAAGYNSTSTNNTLVWVILAIAAVAIIALVWYYATQTNDRYDDRH